MAWSGEFIRKYEEEQHGKWTWDDNDEGGEEQGEMGLVPPFVFLVIKLTKCALTYIHTWSYYKMLKAFDKWWWSS